MFIPADQNLDDFHCVKLVEMKFGGDLKVTERLTEDIRIDSVVFPKGTYLDIGTSGDLVKARDFTEKYIRSYQ